MMNASHGLACSNFFPDKRSVVWAVVGNQTVGQCLIVYSSGRSPSGQLELFFCFVLPRSFSGYYFSSFWVLPHSVFPFCMQACTTVMYSMYAFQCSVHLHALHRDCQLVQYAIRAIFLLGCDCGSFHIGKTKRLLWKCIYDHVHANQMIALTPQLADISTKTQ